MIHVAVAIFRRDNLFLMQQRPAGKPYQGYWEFPGGKLEQAESAQDALVRECKEELAVNVTDTVHLFDVTHKYPDNDYSLHIYQVNAWQGDFVNQENQTHAWFSATECPDKILQANHDIISRLSAHATS